VASQSAHRGWKSAGRTEEGPGRAMPEWRRILVQARAYLAQNPRPSSGQVRRSSRAAELAGHDPRRPFSSAHLGGSRREPSVVAVREARKVKPKLARLGPTRVAGKRTGGPAPRHDHVEQAASHVPAGRARPITAGVPGASAGSARRTRTLDGCAPCPRCRRAARAPEPALARIAPGLVEVRTPIPRHTAASRNSVA